MGGGGVFCVFCFMPAFCREGTHSGIGQRNPQHNFVVKVQDSTEVNKTELPLTLLRFRAGPVMRVCGVVSVKGELLAQRLVQTRLEPYKPVKALFNSVN